MTISSWMADGPGFFTGSFVAWIGSWDSSALECA
jgi:hypothetical protein